jgi:hypothetical protein
MKENPGSNLIGWTLTRAINRQILIADMVKSEYSVDITGYLLPAGTGTMICEYGLILAGLRADWRRRNVML